MATGAPGTNGVWQYGEDDSEATFSALLNKAASTTDTAIGLDRGRLTTLEGRPLAGLVPVVPSSVVIATGTGSANALGQVTFTGATAVSLNGIFTSAYRNYRLLYTCAVGSVSNGEIRLRYRASGTDFSGANYYQAGQSVSIGNQVNGYSGNALSYVGFSESATTNLSSDYYSGSSDIRSPQIARFTTLQAQNFAFRPGTGESMYNVTNQLANTNQYDGLTFFVTQGTTSGVIQVYGYND